MIVRARIQTHVIVNNQSNQLSGNESTPQHAHRTEHCLQSRGKKVVLIVSTHIHNLHLVCAISMLRIYAINNSHSSAECEILHSQSGVCMFMKKRLPPNPCEWKRYTRASNYSRLIFLVMCVCLSDVLLRCALQNGTQLPTKKYNKGATSLHLVIDANLSIMLKIFAQSLYLCIWHSSKQRGLVL